MKLNLNDTIKLLGRTQTILSVIFMDLPESLLRCNEGTGTWSPYDVLGHLVHGEKTDWIPRVKIILEHGENRAFDPFDREAMLASNEGKSVQSLLDEFTQLRRENLRTLQMLNLTSEDLARRGTHPALGTVTLDQHLATWVVHDLDHVSQILRVIAKQHVQTVGPWKEYLSILMDRPS